MSNPTREAIFAARKLPRKEVYVPEWNLSVWVRVMTGTERDEYEVDIMKNRDATLRNMRAKLIVRCTVNEAGELIFRPEDIEELGKDSWLPLDRIATAAQEINKLTEASMEEIKGNSLPIPGERPSSPSP